MLYDRILEFPKLASYPQSNVPLFPGGEFGVLTGSRGESVRSYESRLRMADVGGTIGLSAAAAPAAKASPSRTSDVTTRQDRFQWSRPWKP